MKLVKICKKKGGGRKLSLLGMALASAAFAGFEQIDGKDYWRDDAGNLHQYLYVQGHTTTLWGPVFLNQPGDTETAPYDASAIWVTSPDLTYSTSWNFPSTATYDLCGMCFKKSIVALDGSPLYNMGAYGIRTTLSGFTLKVYNPTINLAESQEWSGLPAETLSSSMFTIAIPGYTSTTYSKSKIVATDGDVTLTLKGDMRLLLGSTNCNLSSCDVVVEKPAYLAVKRYPFSSGEPAYEGRLGARSLTLNGGAGLIFGTLNSTLTDFSKNTNSIPILSPDRIAPLVVLTNSALLSASSETTVTGGVAMVAAAGSVSRMTGKYILADSLTQFGADGDGTLDLTGATFRPLEGKTHSVTLKGTGTIRLAGETFEQPSFQLSGSPAIAFTGLWPNNWDFSLAAASQLTVDVEGVLYLTAAALAGYAGGDIAVAGGTLVLDSAAALPAGVKVSTSGDGALLLLDPTGFDAASRMDGTRNLLPSSACPLVVTDAPREGETVEVAEGCTLEVFGSGLAASSSVALKPGASIVFHRTATLYAPVSSTGAVKVVSADHSVTGTLAGAFSATGSGSTTSLSFIAPGLVRLAGGGTPLTVKLMRGSVEIVSNLVSSGSIYLYAGHLTVRDQGQLKFLGKWYYLYINQTQTDDVTFEVADGGIVTTAGSQYVYIGGDTRYKSRLLISRGGRFLHSVPERFYINRNESNNSVNGNGIFEIDGGTFETAGYIRGGDSTSQHSRIILRDCVWKSSAINYGYNMYGRMVYQGNTPVSIEGNVLINLSGYDKNSSHTPDGTSVTNQMDGTGRWTAKPGARMRVICSPKFTKDFVFANSTGDGLTVDLTNSTINLVVYNSVAAGEGAAADPFSMTWIVPPTNVTAGTVTAFGTEGVAGPLVASYLVPNGAVFDGSATNGWHSGFTSHSVSNIAFDAGSLYRFPAFGAAADPLAISGSLSLPASMDYFAEPVGEVRNVFEVPVIVPELGVQGADCEWRCIGGDSFKSRAASLSVADDALCFTYLLKGTSIVIR